MIYPLSLFSGIKKAPFFYSNFVQTIDGKVAVGKKDGRKYWPIGSKLDFETLLWLRAQGDVLIHGKKTALGFHTLQTLAKKEFKEKREKLGKNKNLIYMVLTSHPDDRLEKALGNPPSGVTLRIVDGSKLSELAKYFRENNLKKILVEGGPTIMAAFLAENLIDEMFVTIAPKIFGNDGNTKTMAEGYIFPPNKIPQFKLISVKNINSELYLRYRKI